VSLENKIVTLLVTEAKIRENESLQTCS